MATTTPSKRLLAISADSIASFDTMTYGGLNVATESWVSTQIANLVSSAPGTLDTLNELAAALGDDPNFATTMTNALAGKLATTHDMTLTLSGDASGSATFTNMGNATLSVTVANDSHTHDGRYYTETEVNNLLAGKLSTTGKAADSNLLDGLDSSRFLYTSSSVFSGDWNTLTDSDYEIQLREVQNITSGAHSNYPTGVYTYGSVLAWQLASATFALYASHTGDLVFQTGWNNDGYSGWRNIWHTGNFNPSSYLTTSGKAADSNLLDGLDLHTGRNNEANKVVRTDGNGYIQAGWINTTSGNTTSTITDFYVNTNDGYIRKANLAHVKSQLGLGSAAYVATSAFDAAGSAAAVNDRIDNDVIPLIPTNNNQLTNGAGYITDGNTGWNNTYGFITNNISTGITINGSLSRGTYTSVSQYHTGADNIVLKGNSVGISGIFFESEKDGTNINHPSDFGFIQYHAYGTSTSGESNELIIGVSNDADDHLVFNAPNTNGLKFRVGASATDYTVYHSGNLSLATLGYTGATNANYITNNNQLTNGAGYITGVAWGDVTGKPSSFTPSAHTHAISEVDGLQAELDSKQAAGSYAASNHNHTYDVNNAWLRDNGDNANVKLYGNSRQMVFRTDGTTEYASGVGGYAFAWMYGGDASGNRRMLLGSDGRLWTSYHGWLDTAFAAASHNHSAADITSGTLADARIASAANWNTAYNNHITGIAVTGTTTKTITLTQNDGGTISAAFSDLSGAGGDGNDFLTGASWDGGSETLTLNISGQPDVTVQLTDTMRDTDTNTWRPIDDTPVNGATTTSISSNWAFDNVKTPVPAGAVFTDTQYSVGDGGLTQKNFTTTLKTKLDGIATGADVTPSWVPATDPGYLTSIPAHTHGIAEVDGLDTALNDKADANHNHDGRYYTESEVDTLLAGKANSSHTHSYLPLSGGTLTGDLTVSGNQVITAGSNADVKFSVWSGTTYGIGMTSGVTYGGLNDYAMTFCMNNDSDRGFWWGYSGQSKSAGAMSLTTGGILTVASSITAGGDITAFSDIRVKENIQDLEGSLDKVTQLRGVSYNKIGSEEKSIGVIAQEIQEVLPEVVREGQDGMLSVAYGNITAVLIEAIKEQQDIIAQLEERIVDLENRM
jgi:hypothetical protein